MARSTYIYIIVDRRSNDPVAAFTVKYEANDWAADSLIPIEHLKLVRVRDGERRLTDRKVTKSEFIEIPFDTEPYAG